MLQPKTQHRIHVTVKSHGLLTIELREMPISRHHTLAARGIMYIAPEQPYYILVSNFSDRQVRLPKRMIIARCRPFPGDIQPVDFDGQKVSSIQTPEIDSMSSDPSAELHSNVSPGHYKATETRHLQMSRRTVVQNDNFSRLALY